MARRSYIQASAPTETKKKAPHQSSLYSRPFPTARSLQEQNAEQPSPQMQAPAVKYNALTLPTQRPDTTATEMPLMPKLTVGAVNDRDEQEADRVAAQVVQQLNAPPDAMQRQGYGEVDSSAFEVQPLVQRKGSSQGGMMASPELEHSIQRERSKGQHLAEGIRQPMETAMGADFSGVRIHTDSTANQLSESIQAKAFTTGQDVFFRQGAYAPESRSGQELLAHELTHVVQQNGSAIQPKLSNTPPTNLVQRDGNDIDEVTVAALEESDYDLGESEEDLTAMVVATLEEIDGDLELGPSLTAEQIAEIKTILDFVAELLKVRQVDVPDVRPEGPAGGEGSDGLGGDTEAPTYTYLELLILYVDHLIEGAKQQQTRSSTLDKAPAGTPKPGAEPESETDEGMKMAKGLRKALAMARSLSKLLEPLAKVKDTAEASPIGLASLADGKITLNVFESTVTFSPSDQQATVDFPTLELPKKPFEAGIGLPIPIAPGLYVANEIGLQGQLLLTPSTTADIRAEGLTANLSGKGSNLGLFMKLGVGAGIPGIATLEGGVRGDLKAELGALPLGVLTAQIDEASSTVSGTVQFNLDAAIKGIVSLFAKASILKGLFKKEYTRELGAWEFGQLQYASDVYPLGNVALPTKTSELVSENDTKEVDSKPVKEKMLEITPEYQAILDLYTKHSENNLAAPLPMTGDSMFIWNFLMAQAPEIAKVYPAVGTNEFDIEENFSSKALIGYDYSMIEDSLEKARAQVGDKSKYLTQRIVEADKETCDRDIYNAVALCNIFEELEAELKKIEAAYQAYQSAQPKSLVAGYEPTSTYSSSSHM
ncbi:MAG: DUF4157 domain-containing protein [Spirulina sp. SIO3F2]|nr:DUF4157 domain-containing protein [Spirulina sp. SIO3F2]